ncbi:hypothetical protein ACU8OL_04660 [Rhizobium leguminosarum]|uniref:hypothetical protein n=1 Tax=Rhizobium leguminosarum TaxID=384 RepID=UPI0019815268|nr:hypothetical protein [Rhizobium leguminosarum]
MTTVYTRENENGDIVEVFGCQQPGMSLTARDDASVEVRKFFRLPAEIISVSSRQFKLQLFATGLLDRVDAWVAQQPRDVRIAYDYSGVFVKDSPMMMAGFAAMGFNPQQIDDFFAAAAQL